MLRTLSVAVWKPELKILVATTTESKHLLTELRSHEVEISVELLSVEKKTLVLIANVKVTADGFWLFE